MFKLTSARRGALCSGQTFGASCILRNIFMMFKTKKIFRVQETNQIFENFLEVQA